MARSKALPRLFVEGTDDEHTIGQVLLRHRFAPGDLPEFRDIGGKDGVLRTMRTAIPARTRSNVDRAKLEHLVHVVFAAARLNIEIKDRSGNLVVPREWFLMSFASIDGTVKKIRDGTITRYNYDANAASFVF